MIVEFFVRKKNTTKIKISASQRISNIYCILYDYNKKCRLLTFLWGYKFYMNSPKGYNRKTISVQNGAYYQKLVYDRIKCC